MPAEVDTTASAINTNAPDSPAPATAAKFAPIEDGKTDETLRPSVENDKVDSTAPAKNGVASTAQEIAGDGDDDHQVNDPGSYNNFDEDDDLDDDDGDDNLTPPPDSPSPVPSLTAVNNNSLQDEIVVGTKSNGVKPSARVQADQDDVDMVDADISRGGYPKRKRNSMYASLEDDASDVAASPSLSKPDSMAMLLKGRDKVRGITLGYWRDSEVPEKEYKHQVVGFIDVRDRLRTRVQATSRFGQIMTDRFPLPPGPGGSWVTFERIVFEDHLVHLDHEQIKEYVKVRGETWGTETTDEEVAANNSAAVKEAVARVQARPAPENAPFQQPIIAYGEDIPDHAKVNRAHEKKKRRLNSIVMPSPQTPSLSQQQSFTVDTPDVVVPPPRGRGGAKAGTVYDDIPGTRPTKVVVGYWAKSQETDPKDKHAVYGVLGSNDMFRVKLVKHTRDGRAINGDFPSGPGAVWINWEEVVFEPHLRKLERAEIKEYCRIRQSHYDAGELPQDRISNETKAVHEAQVRVEFGRPQNPMAANQLRQAANEPMILPSRSQSTYQGTSNPQLDDDSEQPQHDVASTNESQNVDLRERPARHIASDDNYDDEDNFDSGPGTGHELRQSRRSTMAMTQAQKEIPRPARHSLPNASELRAANRRPAPASVPVPAYSDSSDRMARVNSIAQQNLAIAESHQVRISQRQSINGGNVNGGPYHSDTSAASFGAATSQMQRIWAMQEEQRLMPGAVDRPAPVEEIKVEVKEHAGITYARKKNGPFPGKLASNGTLISIDGEDYVEYRVLTKPSFTF